jgi:hypothetical protein
VSAWSSQNCMSISRYICRRDAEVIIGSLLLACAQAQFAKAEVALRHQGTHVARLTERRSRTARKVRGNFAKCSVHAPTRIRCRFKEHSAADRYCREHDELRNCFRSRFSIKTHSDRHCAGRMMRAFNKNIVPHIGARCDKSTLRRGDTRAAGPIIFATAS